MSKKNLKNLTDNRELGNAKVPDFRCRKFFFTYNNYTESHYLNILNYLKNNTLFYLICKEVAPTTGTPHLHFYFEFKNQKWLHEVINECPEMFFVSDYKKAKGDHQHQINYLSKSDPNYITNINLKPTPRLKIIENLYPWQSQCEKLLSENSNDRTVYWIYDEIGCNGKTQFLKYMVHNHKAIFTCGGKRNDIINLIFNNKKYMLESQAIILWNLPRDINNDFISYEAIEMIKDGCISNNKFECGSFICNSPQLMILGNRLPNFSKLTSDRWKIFTIEGKNLIEYKNNPLDAFQTLEE